MNVVANLSVKGWFCNWEIHSAFQKVNKKSLLSKTNSSILLKTQLLNNFPNSVLAKH